MEPLTPDERAALHSRGVHSWEISEYERLQSRRHRRDLNAQEATRLRELSLRFSEPRHSARIPLKTAVGSILGLFVAAAAFWQGAQLVPAIVLGLVAMGGGLLFVIRQRAIGVAIIGLSAAGAAVVPFSPLSPTTLVWQVVGNYPSDRTFLLRVQGHEIPFDADGLVIASRELPLQNDAHIVVLAEINSADSVPVEVVEKSAAGSETTCRSSNFLPRSGIRRLEFDPSGCTIIAP